MRIFEDLGKINFVDENNRFVGFDYQSNCCESFGWLIRDELLSTRKELNGMEGDTTEKLEGYSFDEQFLPVETPCDNESIDYDGGGSIVFKLVAKDKPDLYLHLYNYHNGYYSHGLKAKHNDVVTFETYL